ncbi:hypothetical protein E2562_021929 [Oryza meyeriana var. granulata]|uniref:PPC domain-containing protein n=1 Tax=Oryza meyeriana var. granulata TaxID=110450 RepID=A0A6G1DLB2_9ORYZ|nr:hypothetical protein E2562_021929 [Oryza meyeriana var. granulata]
MSFGERDKSKESMYQEREDIAGIRFTTPPPPSQQQQLDCFSDEVDSRGSAEMKETVGSGGQLVVAGGGDGAISYTHLDVYKRGSKNKPKPPVVITREAEPAAAMRPHVIEIPGGRDVAEALARFASRRNLGICVLAGTGAVANVSLRHPSPGVPGSAPAAIVFHGRYEILSLSATFLPPAMSSVAPQAAVAAAGLSISLAGPHGQIVGGSVAGPLYAATTVVVVAAAFTNPTFHRLPADDDASVSVSVSLSGSGDGDEHRGHQHQPEAQEPRQLRRPPPHLAAAAASAPQPVEPCGAPIYACHPQPQDVMWPPPARTPHPPPPPY